MTTHPRSAGFTLIETMVSVAIFVVVAFIVTTVFITIVDANRKAQSIRLVMDNLNFSIDSMSLRMREGTDYQCVVEDVQGCNRISFKAAGINAGEVISYGWIKPTASAPGQIGRCEGSATCTLEPITAPQINIQQFSVNIDNQASKRAVILINGTAGAGRTLTEFSIQTSVSERN